MGTGNSASMRLAEESMHIRRYYTNEDPSGDATWRYLVIVDDGTLRVEITRRQERYYWALLQNMLTLEGRGAEPYSTREQALEAAVAWIQAREARRPESYGSS
jgi:hypothetical protein